MLRQFLLVLLISLLLDKHSALPVSDREHRFGKAKEHLHDAVFSAGAAVATGVSYPLAGIKGGFNSPARAKHSMLNGLNEQATSHVSKTVTLPIAGVATGAVAAATCCGAAAVSTAKAAKEVIALAHDKVRFRRESASNRSSRQRQNGVKLAEFKGKAHATRMDATRLGVGIHEILKGDI